ncbi:hypothetical protein N473_22935 [Pseudoalteromonas luteoviolacea CPMOR-1]|uniref:DUF1653 domain-containing protein n=1 Tax=Pseudoalteromonas luteoviolacea CPMOR-1 TaxID=1365248 RepID=A0A167JC87_9GAMM|nr:DUF1653 domain-containing protein [Pseudoalteromonas luteoviolacea]KZN60893.1 hypothetical protein N473_22935 [Pseudoalteromonas luteoviolacea CPMOR-1]
MPEEVKVGIYRHYKGKDYKVLCIATHSETEEQLVVYQTLYGAFDHWVRPLTMFNEHVQIDGKTVPRFKYIGKE